MESDMMADNKDYRLLQLIIIIIFHYISLHLHDSISNTNNVLTGVIETLDHDHTTKSRSHMTNTSNQTIIKGYKQRKAKVTGKKKCTQILQ